MRIARTAITALAVAFALVGAAGSSSGNPAQSERPQASSATRNVVADNTPLGQQLRGTGYLPDSQEELTELLTPHLWMGVETKVVLTASDAMDGARIETIHSLGQRTPSGWQEFWCEADVPHNHDLQATLFDFRNVLNAMRNGRGITITDDARRQFSSIQFSSLPLNCYGRKAT